MIEEWKYIAGYGNLYQVSNLGRVRSFQPRWKKPRMIKPSIDNGGYQILTLVGVDGTHHTKTVHRLVAGEFLEIPPLDVNHKDGNKRNNRLSNLDYCTKSENTRHAIKNGLLKPNFTNIAVKKRKPILQININTGNTIREFESAHEASRITGINRGNISRCCREGGKTCNYLWKFKQ